ncbi:MAG TPA: pyridoxamine 5'-phosphate oxidase family protein [Hyphomicrobiales bacterium]|nr:pyridoxamine 5'-phosphate oxidase family protein [Hyphomicrobiales bacterium]
MAEAAQAGGIAIPAAVKHMVDHALVERHPMLVSYVDVDDRPVLTFRGSTQVFADDKLAIWVRHADGAFIRAIGRNPNVALMYRNEDTKATYQFRGRAAVSAADADRRRVFDSAPEAERNHDPERRGAALVITLDSLQGYAGLGPGGPIDPVKMTRG